MELQQLSTQEWMRPVAPTQQKTAAKAASTSNVALRKLLAAKRGPREGENKENTRPAGPNQVRLSVSGGQHERHEGQEKSVELVKQVGRSDCRRWRRSTRRSRPCTRN